jgi:hypothetical protein
MGGGAHDKNPHCFAALHSNRKKLREKWKQITLLTKHYNTFLTKNKRNLKAKE